MRLCPPRLLPMLAAVELLQTIALYGLCFGLSGFIAWQHPNWKGVIVSSLTLWFCFFLATSSLLAAYSTGGPGGAGLMIWMFGGWAPSIIFAGLSAVSRQALFPPCNIHPEKPLERG
jgi:hypothetical protein